MKKNLISFEEIQKICVRMPNWVGDVVMATPFLKNLRKAFPHQKIDLIMRAHLIPILEDFSYVDEIFPIYDKGWRGPFQSAQKLRHHKYDLAFILPHSFRCALTFKLASIPIRIGFGGALHS
ncbi:MAG: lipopolysaccharide heptosyltransferase II, partial [Planctomycetota bacterium]